MANIQPSRVKYRKVQKGRIYGTAQSCNDLAFGEFGIQALERCRMTAAQLEAARVAISRSLKRKGKMWMRVFPHKPVTQKPAEVRMGSGKGNVEYWAAIVRPGTMLFEVSGVPLSAAREAMRLADTKLPIRCRFISREQQEQYL